MNRLSFAKREQVITSLVEGNSIASTCRITGVAKMTVLKLLADVGTACENLQDRWLRDLDCKRVQVDEIWSFVGMKAKNVPAESYNEFGIGDVWTFIALDADSKLVVTWRLGWRDEKTTNEFIYDLSQRMRGRIQLTSDGFKAYRFAVETSFNARGGHGVDYAMLMKNYAEAPKEDRRRYSPSRFVSCELKAIFGNPDEKHISTSFVERSNLTWRMCNRRMTRLTNAFSKNVDNHAHQLALNFAHYNFVRIHKTLRCTPAMAAGIVNGVWSIGDLVKVADEYEIMQDWPLAKAS